MFIYNFVEQCWVLSVAAIINYPLANEVAKGYSNATFRNILVNTRINILQWIFTKLGTYLVLKRIWNPIDFQGQRSNFNARGYATLCVVPLLLRGQWFYIIYFIQSANFYSPAYKEELYMSYTSICLSIKLLISINNEKYWRYPNEIMSEYSSHIGRDHIVHVVGYTSSYFISPIHEKLHTIQLCVILTGRRSRIFSWYSGFLYH